METFAPLGAESTLIDAKPNIQYRVRYFRTAKDKMTTKGRTRLVPTVTVDQDYGLRVESRSKGIVAAFGATIDLSPKSTCIVSLAPNEPSKLAFLRVGAALRNSLAKASSANKCVGTPTKMPLQTKAWGPFDPTT